MRPFFPVKVYGDRNVPHKKSLIVANHISGWDPIIFTLATKGIHSFVYKAEFRKNWFLRWAFDGLDLIPVKRGTVDMNSSRTIIEMLENDKSVALFPEGTRNPNVDCLQEFRTGAALFALKTHAPIRPFYIWDKTKCFHKNYIIIGDEFTLEEFYDKPLTKETLLEATEVIKQKVDALRVQLNEILAAKNVKRRKRTKKEIAATERYNAKQRNLLKTVEQQEVQHATEQHTDNEPAVAPDNDSTQADVAAQQTSQPQQTTTATEQTSQTHKAHDIPSAENEQ